jgi:pimeloyl-ACP methyl ester carboxylesterase
MERRELEVRAADGRRLLAEVSGPEDGDLVLFHTGTPGSRYLFDRHLEEGAERGLRHVTYSRPGYHGSDRQPGRTYADSAADSAAVVDALGVECFYALGFSGGGAPVLACAALLPDRVLAATSAAALGPREGEGLDWLAGTSTMNVAEFRAVAEGPAALERSIREIAAEMGAIEDGEQLREGFGDAFCQADRDCAVGEFLEYQVTSCQKAARDSLWGWFDDDVAMWNEWGFDLARITVPVTIWQGAEDHMVPPQNGLWLADHVPGAKLRLLAGEGHISLSCNYYGAILDDLVESAREAGRGYR